MKNLVKLSMQGCFPSEEDMMRFINRVVNEQVMPVQRLKPQIEMIDQTKCILFSAEIKQILKQLSNSDG